MSTRSPLSPSVPVEARSEYRRMTPNGRAPEIAAMASKMVPEMASQRFGQGYLTTSRRDKPLQAPDMGLLQRISDLTANDVSDAQTIFQILPETELAMQILVSSILAPKDLVTTGINFSLESNRFNSELAASMLGVITDHFEKIYKISDLLKPSLQDALFLTGSYPLLILPESSIDRAINNPGRVSMESIKDDFTNDGAVRCLGFLGNKPADTSSNNRINFGLESLNGHVDYVPKLDSCLGLESLVEVIDNPNVLKMNSLQRRIAQDKTYHLLNRRHMTAVKSASMNVSQEAYAASGARTSVGFATQSAGFNFQHRPVELLTPARDVGRATIGHPLVMKLPSEAVIPVHQPSNPEKHLGYFVMVDGMGNPLNSAQQRDYYSDMSNSLNSNSSMGSQLLAQAKQNMQGQSTDRQSEIDEMARIYGQFLEKELTDRLRNGIYGNQVEVTAPTEVYRVMFARAMQRQQTQVLYVPAEMMTYIAFDYNKYGIGQSLLQQSKILGGMRVLSLFAETMGSIKNAINRTRLGITLDPEDPNPTHTVEFLMGEYAKTRQGSFPLGATNPTDIISYLQNASVDVEVTGNTRWPEVKFEVSERQSNRVKPDDTMTKDLRDRHLMSMGLSPDMVDAGRGAEFATSVLANNLLLAKRVLTYQSQLEEFLRDFVKKYILADGYLMDEMRRLINENKHKLTREQQKAHALSEDAAAERRALEGKDKGKVSTESMNEQLENLEEMGHDAVIMEFLQCVLVSLPKPDMATIKNQMEAYKTQDEAYNEALKAYINQSYLETHGLGGLKDLVEPTLEAVKAELMRRWMRDNNVLPELHDLLAGDEDDRPDIFKNVTEHMETMGGSLLKIMYQFAKQRQTNDPAVKRLAKLTGEPMADDSYGGGDSSYGGGADSSGGGDSFDAGGGDMAALDDAPPGGDGLIELDTMAGTDAGEAGGEEAAETTEQSKTEEPSGETETAEDEETGAEQNQYTNHNRL
jgi:hypothetical protein